MDASVNYLVHLWHAAEGDGMIRAHAICSTSCTLPTPRRT
jgi:hypothetical protein